MFDKPTEAVTRQVSAYLSAAVYQAFRLLYSAREKNPQEAFSLDLRLYAAQAEALMDLSLGKARFLLEGGSLEDSRGMAQSQLPPLAPDMLLRESPLQAPSLLELVQEVEGTIAGKQ